MPEKPTEVQPAETRWAISLDWFPSHQRSAVALVKDYLCPECTKRLISKKEPLLKNLLASIESCCSQNPDFINDKLPILESTFRIFLRNGNRPMTLQEISSELAQWRFGDVYRTSPVTLKRILKNDLFYGLREVPG